jgi:hypothetical protein
MGKPGPSLWTAGKGLSYDTGVMGKMRITEKSPKVVLLALAVCGLFLAGIAGDKIADNARAYQATLEGMPDARLDQVIAKLLEWKFEVLEIWMADNPTAKEVGKHNRSKIKFSKKDIEALFMPGGSFKVVVYNKLVGTDSSMIGEIDGSGMGLGKDAKVNLEQFTVIRVVFKDDKMINFKVWPKMETSGFSGGTWLRR